MNQSDNDILRGRELVQAYNLLIEGGIKPWICHGTLLGIVRENRILPWDHDIDLAVWASKVSKEKVRNIFIAAGFLEEEIFGDMNCLYFYSPKSILRIDISFYEVEKGMASIRWVCHPEGKTKSRILFVLRSIYEKIESPSSVGRQGFHDKVARIIYFWGGAVRRIFDKKSRWIIRLISSLYDYKGYSYDAVMLNQYRHIEFLGCQLRVPSEAERCLRETYGASWKVPKSDYIWYEEAENLLTFD